MINILKEHYKNKKCASAWKQGVNEYVLELLESLEENYKEEEITNEKQLRKCLLSGAQNWDEYSWGGCSLIYDSEIAERLCTPSQLKRYDGGRLDPSRQERWLDLQKYALIQAASEIIRSWGFNE